MPVDNKFYHKIYIFGQFASRKVTTEKNIRRGNTFSKTTYTKKRKFKKERVENPRENKRNTQ